MIISSILVLIYFIVKLFYFKLYIIIFKKFYCKIAGNITSNTEVSSSQESNERLKETGTCLPNTALTEDSSSLLPLHRVEDSSSSTSNSVDVTSDFPDSCMIMSDPAEPESPPIAVPKASYAIDWDNFDENTNPFQSRNRLGSSPPRESVAKAIPDEKCNPFKPRRKLAQSPPPGEGKVEHLSNNNNNDLESVVADSGDMKVNADTEKASSATAVKSGATIVK